MMTVTIMKIMNLIKMNGRPRAYNVAVRTPQDEAQHKH